MANYELMSDEIILLQSQNAASEKSLGGSEIILTDKRIIFISKGFFGKVKGVEYYPLDQISIFAGEPRIECIHETGIYQLRIGFKSAIKTFNIDDGSKKTINLWANTVYKALTGKDSPNLSAAPESFLSGVGVVADTLKGTIDTFKKSFGNKIQQVIEQVSCNCPSCGHRIAGFKGQKVKCPYCGTEQIVS